MILPTGLGKVYGTSTEKELTGLLSSLVLTLKKDPNILAFSAPVSGSHPL